MDKHCVAKEAQSYIATPAMKNIKVQTLWASQ